MKDHFLKDKKILEQVRKIAIARRKGEPPKESDYSDLMESIQKLHFGTNETIASVLADSITRMSKDGPQKMMLSQTFASHIDGLNLKTKYAPKIRGEDVPVRYFGSEWSMKELTRKTKHPLHYLFLSDSGQDALYAFDKYQLVHEALEREKLANTILFEMVKLMEPKSGNGTCAHCAGDSLDPAYWDETIYRADEYCLNQSAIRPSLNSLFFEDINYEGELLELAPGFCYPNLLDKWRRWVLFLVTDTWNDAISSVKNGDGVTVLCEHVFGAGASITLQGSVPHPDYKLGKTNLGSPCVYIEKWLNVKRRNLPRLDMAGWNDRISSVYHYFF